MRSPYPFLPPHAPQPLPGDLVGFSGADLLADAINLATLGWPRRGLSHVAIVAHYRDRLCVYESTTRSSLSCLIAGRPVDGTQCHPISMAVCSYPGRVYHYPLHRPLEPDDADALELRLRRLCQVGRPYDYLGALASRSTLGGLWHRLKFGRQDLGHLFCSELVAAMWAKAGILNTSNASKWNPNALARYAVRHGIADRPVLWKPREA